MGYNRYMGPCWYALIGLVALAGCGSPPAYPARDTTPTDIEAPSAPAAPTRAPTEASSHFAIECFDVYAECAPVRGLPALSADHTRVALADSGPEDARDEFVLSVHVLDVASGAKLGEVPVLTHEDRVSGLDAETGELSPELHRAVQARIAGVEQMLAAGGFAALAYLGTVHQAQAGEQTAGLRATFDGRELTIHDQDRVRWRRAIGDSVSFVLDDGAHCGPFPVAEIAVWADRASGVALARVSYTTSDICQIEDRYLVWRSARVRR